jgi:NitT/TauT family transport system ATP-binding protein
MMENGPAPAEPSLILESVTKEFLARGRLITAIRDVTLTVPERSFFTIVGPSGCGKSTILNLIAGLERRSSGSILFRGQAVSTGDRRIGYVTQQDNLFPWRTLMQNIVFPLEIAGVPSRDAADQARHWINKVGLSGFDDAYPHELSGGMRQRANIARTLIYKPDLIMMDEPFGPLDAQTRLQLQQELQRIWDETKVSVLFITHDLAEAIALSTKVAIMSARPGTITEVRDVTLGHPRDLPRMHDNPEYRRMYDDLWETLRSVVEAAQQQTVMKADR